MKRKFHSSQLSKIDGVIHGFGTAEVMLSDYLNDSGHKDAIHFKTHQIHGADVHVLDGEIDEDVLNGDAFITSKANVVCFIRTADCVPILVADPVRGVVGAIHAGWRGTAADVVGATIKKMISTYGSDPSDIRAAIGPAICDECYEVGDEVIVSFSQKGLPVDDWLKKTDGNNSVKIDLKKANRDLLIRSGVSASSVEILPNCTKCEPETFASHRRNPTLKSRQVSFIFTRRHE